MPRYLLSGISDHPLPPTPGETRELLPGLAASPLLNTSVLGVTAKDVLSEGFKFALAGAVGGWFTYKFLSSRQKPR